MHTVMWCCYQGQASVAMPDNVRVIAQASLSLRNVQVSCTLLCCTVARGRAALVYRTVQVSLLRLSLLVQDVVSLYTAVLVAVTTSRAALALRTE